MFTELEARVGLIASKMTLREPFIAAVFTKLEREFSKDGTANVNGKRVQYGADFCDTLDDEELLFVSLHEGMHVVFMHMWRREGRDPKMWNVATDANINATLIKLGYKMPKGGVVLNWVTDDMSAEDIYNKLMDQRDKRKQQGQGQGQGQPNQQDDMGAGGWDDSGDLEDAPDAANATDMEATIMTAAKMAKACGDKSALVQRVLGGALNPTVHWTDVLRPVLTSAARDDYTYRRFNRRLISQGVYMPALYSEALGGLVVGVDTSGSVSEGDLNQIAAEINAIVEDCHPEWVEVIYCDSSINKVQRFTQGEQIQLFALGGGGTRFKPVFDHVRGMQEKVAAMIYLTDLEGNTDECEPVDCPVVWGCTTTLKDQRVPFGELVQVRV
jgi:predicted metal-dependent peptidase